MRILVIDDDPAVCSVLKRFLEREGYRVERLSDPRCLEQAVREFNPNVILCDVNLGDISGIEVSAKLQSLLPKAKIYLFTGGKLSDALMNTHQTSFEVLYKPFSLTKLVKVIGRPSAT